MSQRNVDPAGVFAPIQPKPRRSRAILALLFTAMAVAALVALGVL